MKKFIAFLTSVFSINFVSAHCPLCTIGAGAVAGGAVWLGVSKVVVALFLGAFAMSMGLWFGNIVKKKYIPFQKTIITAVVFLTTLLPLLPLFKAIGPLYLSFLGEYGTTYAVNYSIATSLLGAGILFTSPLVSKAITKMRKGKILPFQGVIITILSLLIIGGVIQILV
ncbi:MAG: hypothetical protein ABIH49_01185 [archaeon]